MGGICINEVVHCPRIHKCPLWWNSVKLAWNTEADSNFEVQEVLTMPGACLNEKQRLLSQGSPRPSPSTRPGQDCCLYWVMLELMMSSLQEWGQILHSKSTACGGNNAFFLQGPHGCGGIQLQGFGVHVRDLYQWTLIRWWFRDHSSHVTHACDELDKGIKVVASTRASSSPCVVSTGTGRAWLLCFHPVSETSC